MVPKTTLTIGATLMIALSALAAPAAAQASLVTGEGAAQAAMDAAGSYYVDGSESIETASNTYDQAHAESTGTAHAANDAYAQAKGSAWENASQVERPAEPACGCDELFSELEQAGQASLVHEERVEKAADVDTELVDAGVDVGAGAQVKALLKNALEGIGDVFNQLTGLLQTETVAEGDAKAIGEDLIHADDTLRGELMDRVGEKQALPGVDPRVDGELAMAHASTVSSTALGQVQGNVP